MTQYNEPTERELMEMLIHQTGVLTEGIVELRIVVTDGFSRINQTLDRVATAQEQLAAEQREMNQTARIQAESISRLITLLERRGEG